MDRQLLCHFSLLGLAQNPSRASARRTAYKAAREDQEEAVELQGREAERIPLASFVACRVKY